MISIGYRRRKAVAEAWKREKALVAEGRGTRDWTPEEQEQILRKGKVKGYEGHHMKSVHDHNFRAGDANNIQFLTRKEHLAAHKGNFRNKTNSYYDYKTGESRDFSRYKPSIEDHKLNNALPRSRVDELTKGRHGDKIDKAREKARETEKRKVNKKGKSEVKSESKTLNEQRARRESAAGSKTTTAETKSKTLSNQRAASASSGRSSGGAKPSKGRSH